MSKDEIIKLADSYNTRCLQDGRLWFEFSEDELIDFADALAQQATGEPIKGYVCKQCGPTNQTDEEHTATHHTCPHSEQATGEPEVGLYGRIAELIAQYGSLRAVARVLECDPGYLSRLASGEKEEPGDFLLQRMGLSRVVTYERIAAIRRGEHG